MARKPDTPCASCGKLLWSGSTSLPAGERTCHPCRRDSPRPTRKKKPGLESWVCAACGADCERERARGQKPKYCDDCANRDWIPEADRLAIYERDGWTCGICLEGVDPDLIGTRSEWRPSLDHIVPRSQGGSDDADNLRLAHQWCNAALADGRCWSEDDFRVSA